MSDTQLIERLSVELDADVQKLTAKFDKVIAGGYSAASKIERSWQGVLDRPLGDAGKALDNLFNSSRMQLISSASSRIGVFGGALGNLGVAGLGAAAAIGAVAGAMNMAQRTLDWAVALKTSADALGVTTTQLQQMDFVAAASDVSIDTMRGSLEKLGTVMGRVQAGIGGTSGAAAKKAFGILGLTPDDLKPYHDAADLLPVIADKIRDLSPPMQEFVSKALGVQAILPLLQQGGDHIKTMAQQASNLGAVLDSDMIKRLNDLAAAGATADTRFAAASHTIGSLFVPGLIDLKNAAADALNWLSRLFNLPVGSDAEQMADQVSRLTKARAGANAARGGDIVGMIGAGAQIGDLLPGTPRANFIREQDAAGADAMARINQITLREANAYAKPTSNTGNAPTTTPPRGGSGRGARADAGPGSLPKDVQDRLDEASKALDDALAALTGNVQAHADLEKKAVADELARQQTDIQAQIGVVADKKGLTDAQRNHLSAELEVADLAVQAAATAKDQKIDQEAALKIEDEQIDAYKAKIEAQIAELQAQADITTAVAARVAIERHILQLRQQLESDLDGTQWDLAVAQGTMTPAQRSTHQGALVQTHGAQTIQFDKQNATYSEFGQTLDTSQLDKMRSDLANTFQGALEAGIKGGWPGVLQYMSQSFEKALISGSSNLLANIVLGIGSGGASAGAAPPVAGGMGSGIGGFLGLLGGFGKFFTPFAGGTLSAPGGLAIVGEEGPELVNLPGGSGVTSNGVLRQLANASSMRGASNTSLNFDLRGAVMTQDLVNSMNSAVAASEQRSTMKSMMAAQAGRRMAVNDVRSATRNALR